MDLVIETKSLWLWKVQNFLIESFLHGNLDGLVCMKSMVSRVGAEDDVYAATATRLAIYL